MKEILDEDDSVRFVSKNGKHYFIIDGTDDPSDLLEFSADKHLGGEKSPMVHITLKYALVETKIEI